MHNLVNTPSPMAQQPPEGVVTVLFTDIVGSAALKTSQGDAAAQEIVRGHFELLRQQVESHGGREVKTLGDGLMATFVSPRSALTSAIAMQRALADGNRARPPEQQLEVRVGLNAGEAIREDGDIFGSTVDAAARICAKAAGGQILASETVRGIVGAAKELQFRDRGRFRLKGFPERWRLLEVAWEEEAPAVVSPPVLAERTPFVGREAERAELRRLMEQAVAGHGSIVLIRGEPGVGKTRLAQELILEARKHGMFDSTGRCYEMEGAPPYIPYIEMLQQSLRRGPAGFREVLCHEGTRIRALLPELRQVFDDIPPPLELPPEQERLFLFNSIREFLGRVSHTLPLLHILDDLHWADDATLMLLQHIAQHQDKMAILTVATYRDIELDAARPFAQTLESLVRQRLAHRIALKPLPEAGVEAMLRALTAQPPPPALVQAIYRETEGNPFFVEEVFQHLSEQGKLLDAGGHWRPGLQVSELDVPEGVRLVISRRLERVSEECRAALTEAAVVGRDFTFELLEKLSGLDADVLLDAVDEAERANLIVSPVEVPTAIPTDQTAVDQTGATGTLLARPGEAPFSFAHELIRQTLISGLSLPRRQRLHLRVAETMEQVYGKDADLYAADLAHHLYQAGAAADPAKTARFLVLAGDRAIEAAAFPKALRNYDIAFSLQPAGDLAAMADLFYKRGLARRTLDRWDEALADWREAASAYERLGNSEAAVRTYDVMCHHLGWGQRYAEVLELSQRGLAIVGRRDSVHRCRLLGWGGLMLSLAGYPSAGFAMIKGAVAMAERLGDEALLGQEIEAPAIHHMAYLEMRETAKFALKAAELLRRAGGLWYLVDDLMFAEGALFITGRTAESLELWRERQPLAERLGRVELRWGFDASATETLLRTGDIQSFELFWQTAAEHALSLQDPGSIWQTHINLGVVHFWKGRWPEELDSFEEAAKVEPAGAFAGQAPALVLLARAYLGDKSGALAVLRRGPGAVPEPEGRPASSLLFPMLRAARNSGLGLIGLLGIIRESQSMRKRGPLPRVGRTITNGASCVLFAAVEGLAVLGEKAETAKLYPLMLQAIRMGVLFRPYDLRLLDTLAGIAAGAGENWVQAEEHFRTALRRAEDLPHVIEQPEIRRFYASVLLDRNAPGDRETARQLLTEAIEMYRRIGMPKHVEIAEELLGGR